MFLNVYHLVLAVSAGTQTAFEDKWVPGDSRLSLLQATRLAASARRRRARITNSVHPRTAALLQQLVQNAFHHLVSSTTACTHSLQLSPNKSCTQTTAREQSCTQTTAREQ